MRLRQTIKRWSLPKKAAKSQYDMARDGARSEDKAAAAALVQQAGGAVAEVESYLKESALVSPIDGEVSERFPEVGELVGTGAPIMNITDLNDMWVSFSVREDLLKDIKIGSELNAFIPALDNKPVKLKVYYMKDMGSYAAWKATKTTGQFDSKTFEVRARPLEKIADLRPGMSVVMKKKVKRNIMTLKQSLHSIWNVAKREIHRLTSKPIYFFCMLIAPALCVVFFLSLMQDGFANQSADCRGRYGWFSHFP